MITFIIIGIVVILAIGVVAMVWKSGEHKRKDQSETSSARAAAGQPKIGRATGPD